MNKELLNKNESIKEEEIYNISDFFKVFADSTRLKILIALENNELNVNNLSEALNMTKSAVSHQLKFLKLNHLVKNKKIGKNVFYSLDDDHVSFIIQTARTHINEGK